MQLRLSNYFPWCPSRTSNRISVFGLCFGNSSQRMGWLQVVQALGNELDMAMPKVALARIGRALFVASFIWDAGKARTRRASA